MRKITYTMLLTLTLIVITGMTKVSVLIAQTWTTIDGGGTYGISSTTSSNSNFPSVAVLNGGMYAIWQEYTGSAYEVHVKKYDGSSWTTAGNSAGSSLLYSSSYSEGYPKLVYYNNALYAAWSGIDAGINVVHVKKYNGSTWSFTENYSVGDGRTNIHYGTTANAKKIDLCVFNNELYATWVEEANITGIQQVRVSKFNGSLWSSIDGNSTNGINYTIDYITYYNAYNPTLCVYNNVLYAAWQENNSSNISQLRVRRYDGGSTWTFVDGNGTDGLNYNTGIAISDYPISLSSYNGKMYAFWVEALKVRVKRYEGANVWVTDPDGGTGWYHNTTTASLYPYSFSYNNLLYVIWEQNPVPRQVRVVSFDGTTKTFIDGNVAAIGINNTVTNRGHFPKLVGYKGDLITVWSEEFTSTANSPNQIRAKKYPLPPFVESVTVPANGTYISGQTLTFTVNYSKDVVISGGTPYIPITLNTGGTVNALYTSGTGTSTLTFSYPIVAGNADPDGISVGTTISNGGATLQSEDSTPLTANLTLNSVGSTTGVLVEAIVPSVSSINRYNPTESTIVATSVVYRITFSENANNVDVGDFSLSTSGSVAGTIASVTATSGTTIDVTINSISGNGTLRLDLKSTGTGITDNAGNPISGGFTTGQTYTIVKVPQITTQAVSSIGSTNATGNGNINDLGYPNPTAHGVCWNTTGTPTISDSKVDNGAASVTGPFTAAISSLTASTLYHVRAYATNTAGTSYGTEVTFTTLTPNNAPTDISISGTSINENVAGNTSIGTLSSTDPDAGNTFTYSLVTGTGDTDNASFNISGSSLRITSSPDFETKSSFSVRVRTTDQGSLTFEKAFTITINDINETPTDIALSVSSINENVVANSSIGTLSSTDPDAANTFTYTLVAGTGSTDNASFNISGSSLRITGSPDFETKSSYSVRVRTTDQGTLWFEKVFTITITDLNEAPTDISLSGSSISENVVANSTVGTLSSTDQDAANTFTYSLVAGTGSTDNASFNISGNSLRITSSPDFETKSSYSVRVRTTDQGSLTYEKAFTITISNVNETPTDIALSVALINENVVANSTVGTLSTTDPDAGNTFTYTLVAGTGSTDNASFNISGSSLRITGSPDFETKSSFSVRVRSTDQGSLWFEKVFVVTINDLNEAPSGITLSISSIDENVVANSTVGTLSSTDQDVANTFTYTLVAGTGSTDNASFNISGSSLRITGSPDFETKSSYSVRVRTTDQGSLWFEKVFTITISDLNEASTDISLSPSSINENVVANSTVGTLSTTDPDAGNTFTYTLVVGTGDTDNASFNISGNSLRITDSPDYETKNSYSVRIRTTDQESLYYEKTFTITINNVNETPTDVTLSANSIDENVAGNSTVGSLSTTDVDAGNTFTYTLVAGVGDTDNASFNVSGGNLRITNSPDYETKNSYSVRVRTTDQGSLFYEKVFTININDLNEVPANISLSATSIDENVAANSTIGTLSSTDQDAGNTFTYTLVAGAGSTDNASFSISGNDLLITPSPDYETKSSYSIRIRSTDQGSLYFEKAFTLSINNVNETPVVTASQGFSIDENSIVGTVVGTVSATDPDAGTTFSGWAITVNSNLDGDGTNAFAIDASTGQITVADLGDLDRETNISLTIKVTVSDGTNTSAEESVTINLDDVNDVVPVITASQVLYVTEQSPNGTTVGTVVATDGDVTSTTLQNWTITAGNSGGYFAINPSSGVITVVDNTGLNPAINPTFTLTLTVSDGTNTSSSQTISIIVAAINDDNPEITSSQSFAIDENSANGSAVGQVLATDPDYGTVFQGWAITAGNTGNAFAINSTTGAITINTSTALDYEITHSFSLTIQVSDGLHTASGVVTVNINNLNDNAPSVTAASFSINENAANGTSVGTVASTDADGTLNSLTYSITSGNTNSAFAINSATGAITVNASAALDYETTHSFSLTIQVSDGIHTASGVVTVNLNNLNDNAPTVAPATFVIDENSANGTAVGTVVAADADGTLNSLTYSITSGNMNSAFVINSATGAITINKTEEINFEVTPVFNLTVTASDGTLSGNANVRININDVVETGIDDNQSFSIKVYPNPAVEKVNVSIDNLTTGSYTIEIFNLIGSKVFQRDVSAPSEIQTIDLKGFAEGIYFVKAYNKQFSYSKKLIVR